MMRLLKHLPNGDFELTSFNDDHPPPYAILSHTWTEGQEVTYSELLAGTGRDKAGYAKIRFCGERAAADGLEYFWVDTCCINKFTSDELSTAINSMFRWYQRASKCYVYLSDVMVTEEVTDAQAFRIAWVEAFRQSRWFTRGWTLQELLAPPSVEFFSINGIRLGSKMSLEREIHEITKIPVRALRVESLTEFSVNERMEWAANRTTTLKEDRVYCLLGIFGVFLPLIYGEGEAHATRRLSEEIHRQQEGQGMKNLYDSPVCSSLPFPRNEQFVGREEQLQSLERSLLSPTTHQRMTIYGLGGCGKSALALEFAYRALARKTRRLVFWVPAISQESFELAYQEIAIRLRIPGINDNNANVNKLVQETLSAGGIGEWLMIVDNADDPSVILDSINNGITPARLSDYLPQSNGGSILFTTRSRKAAANLTPSNVLEVKDMSKTEAEQLLARRITNQALLTDQISVDKLLDILAYLPLAIVQASAFINNNDISVSNYISLFQHTGTEAELFGEQFEDPSRYQEMDSTIAKTWHISFDQIRRQDRLAAEFLSFIACIDRINIPQSLLPRSGTIVQQAKALGTLTGYAFITERQHTSQADGERFFDMHRLVHMASVWWLDEQGERATWARIAVTRLQELVPRGGHKEKDVWTTYLPHAIHSVSLDGVVDDVVRASLLDRVGRCQATLGQYAAAHVTHRQALYYVEKELGKDHYQTLQSMSALGSALVNQGKYEDAESMHRQTLARRKNVLGPEHQETLISMNNLTGVLDRQGKYEEAESMSRETLARSENVLGPEHPQTLMSMSQLAGVLHRQGKFEEAEMMNRQTIARSEKILGPEHPDTLMSISSLAGVLAGQGKHEEAELMDRQTFALRKKALGPEHPDTLTSMSNLAGVLEHQGKYEEAELMSRQTLALSEKILGFEHPHTLTNMGNLAAVLNCQGEYKKAESMNRQTLLRSEKVLGPEHPDTLTIMGNLAGVLHRQGKYEEAELMNRQTNARCEKILGPEHPHTLAGMSNLAGVLNSQSKYEEAESMIRQTLARSEKVLGHDHPDTLTSISKLAGVLLKQGKYEEAELMNKQALVQRKRVLGLEHPDTLTSMSNLAGVLDRQDKHKEAESMHRQTLARSEKVLGYEHPDTLASVYCLAHLLANQHRYDESLLLYERACTAYCTVLGKNHPTTRACRQHYAEMATSKQQSQTILSPRVPPDSSVSSLGPGLG